MERTSFEGRREITKSRIKTVFCDAEYNEVTGRFCHIIFNLKCGVRRLFVKMARMPSLINEFGVMVGRAKCRASKNDKRA